MPGPAALSHVLLALTSLGATSFSGGTGAEVEAAAGVAPQLIGSDPEAAYAYRVTPMVGVRLATQRHTLKLSYFPRIFRRFPNLRGVADSGADGVALDEEEVAKVEVNRPLLMHQGSLNYEGQASRTTRILGNFTLSLGDADYTATRDLLGTRQQARVLRALVVNLYRYRADIAWREVLSPSSRLEVQLVGEATGPSGDTCDLLVEAEDREDCDQTDGADQAGDVTGALLQPTRTAELGVTWTNNLSAEDELGLVGRVGYQFLDGAGSYLTANPELSFTRRPTPTSAYSIAAGFVALSHVALDPDTVQEGGFEPTRLEGFDASGTANFAAGGRLLQSRGTVVDARMAGGLNWLLDPISRSFSPTVSFNAALGISDGRKLRVDPNFVFFTLLRPPTVLEDEAGQPLAVANYDITDPPDATLFGLDVPVTYAVTRAVTLRVGARTTLRSRRLASPKYDFAEQPEAWVYAGMTVQLFSERTEEPWMQPPDQDALTDPRGSTR